MENKKIFIVEDEGMLRGVLEEMFSTEGFEVKGFPHSEALIEQLKVEKPDVILTDLVLPNIGGFEMLKILKDSLHLNDIPVLIMSNLEPGDNPEKAKSLGAHDYLVKSNLSLEEIVRRVKAALPVSE